MNRRFAPHILTVVLALVLNLVLALPLVGLDAPRPSLVFHQGQPVVAWVERQGAVTVGRVARWDGAWTDLGAVNRDPTRSVASVALAAEGPQLVAAWGERPPVMVGKDQGSGPLHVGLWSPQGWTFPWPSPSRSPRTMADLPQVRLWQGLPWVMWSEITPDFNVENVYLARATADGWSMIDAGTLTTDISSASRGRDFAPTPAGPLLAWSRLRVKGDFQVFAGPWDGGWRPWGGPLNLDPERYAAAPSLALDPQGNGATVAFLEASDPGFRTVVKTWDGRWTDRGTVGQPGARGPKVAWADVLVVVLIDLRGLMVYRFGPEGWDQGTRVPTTPGAFVDTFDLAVGPGARPWVVWAEDDARGQRLGLARWTGAVWEGVEAPVLRSLSELRAASRPMSLGWPVL